jgi:hypothetical protein
MSIRPLALTAAALALAATLPAEQPGPSSSLERRFEPGGQVKMDLSAGEYHIVGSDEDRILIEWSVRDAGRLSEVRVSADVDGSKATIRSRGPSNHFSVTITVPSRSDLDVRLTAGDLEIEGIEGNKEIRSRAGDIDIDLVRPEDYARVEASLWAGDLRAEPLGITKGGLFRSFEWEGKGRYGLYVSLLAGDVRLYASEPSK